MWQLSLLLEIDKSISLQILFSDQNSPLIFKKRNFNKEFGFGYSIQLYNGNEQQARQILTRFNVDFPDRFSKLVYNSPEWKVQVGNYKTKLEADKDLIKFQKKITGIIVVPMGK